jgi:uncharacterized cupin superfamily protein
MRRLNFLQDEPWDQVNDDLRVRWFGHPFRTDMLGASLRELLPRSPGGPMHMHYGLEEMFFVLSGTPTVRTPEGEEQLTPGDVVYFPEGREGLQTFSNPTDEPVRFLGISTKRFPVRGVWRSRAQAAAQRRFTPALKAMKSSSAARPDPDQPVRRAVAVPALLGAR